MFSSVRKWIAWVRTEPAVLAGIALVALLLLLAKIVEDVVRNESGAFDRTILLALRTRGNLAVPVGPPWLHTAMLSITDLGTTIITLVTVMTCVYLWLADRRASAMLVAGSVGLGALFEHGKCRTLLLT